ncbi:hypothetical protein [Streptomyces amritsarensis]|uniref:hypothetical protein n=1 Tax=Streptomyces amritsarensis TaxID=681158 RepID=UPI0036B5BE85
MNNDVHDSADVVVQRNDLACLNGLTGWQRSLIPGTCVIDDPWRLVSGNGASLTFLFASTAPANLTPARLPPIAAPCMPPRRLVPEIKSACGREPMHGKRIGVGLAGCGGLPAGGCGIKGITHSLTDVLSRLDRAGIPHHP